MSATYSVVVRCTAPACRRWASRNENYLDEPCGGCGSPVEPADMAAHAKTLPVSKDDPTEVAKFNTQKAKEKT